jgi:indolepyruvate ferredoxin oxidoreductase beta subunit
MKIPENQQIIISGVGGQGVLFVTRLLAEAAIAKGLSVITSETHGMAQRGGTVVSHLKVGDFASPLIRPAQADGLIALKAESVAVHGAYVRPDGWIVANSGEPLDSQATTAVMTLDAESVARQINNLRAIKLVMLGYALTHLVQAHGGAEMFFCSLAEIQAVVANRLAHKQVLRDAALEALAAGSQSAP